jgi:MFS family permease
MILVGQIFLSQLSDQFNKSLVIFIAGILHFIGYSYLVIVTNFFDLLVMAIITGLGMSILIPTVSVYINEISLERNKGFNLSFITATTQGAGILGFLLGGYLGDIFSINWLFLFSAFSLLSVSVIIILQNIYFKRVLQIT